MKKFKIGIFGSAVKSDSGISERLTQLGQYLATKNIILITGACTGIPYKVVSSAYRVNPNQEIWGFSPATCYENQVAGSPDDDNTIYSKLIYVPENFQFIEDIQVTRKYRNVTSTATVDCGIVISGRWGSLNEFTNLFDMGKVIGVLTGTGGVADELPGLMQKISKPSKAIVIFESDPILLVDKIMQELERRKNDFSAKTG